MDSVLSLEIIEVEGSAILEVSPPLPTSVLKLGPLFNSVPTLGIDDDVTSGPTL